LVDGTWLDFFTVTSPVQNLKITVAVSTHEEEVLTSDGRLRLFVPPNPLLHAYCEQLTMTSSTKMRRKKNPMSMSKMATTTQKAIPGPPQSNSSALKDDDPKEALNEFRVVVETEAAAGEKGDWFPPVLLHTIADCDV
jgi:hypothetical protein